MTANPQITLRLPPEIVRWLRVTAAARGITRSQLVAELVEVVRDGATFGGETEQREDGR